jgi:SPP1 family holin
MNKAGLIRTIVLVIALVNQVLQVKGMSPLPIDDVQIESLVSLIFTITASVITWKHDNFKKKEVK